MSWLWDQPISRKETKLTVPTGHFPTIRAAFAPINAQAGSTAERTFLTN